VSVTIVTMMSLAAATCSADSPGAAPAARSGAIASGRRAHTASAWPRFNTFRAIGVPIVPSPMNPIVVDIG
jgi:hypothetical protein